LQKVQFSKSDNQNILLVEKHLATAHRELETHLPAKEFVAGHCLTTLKERILNACENCNALRNALLVTKN